MSKKWSFIWPILLCLALPLIAAWFAYPDHLPPGFGVFPPQYVQPDPGFNLLVFLAVLAVELVFLAFLLFPQWFGFKPVAPPPPVPKAALPVWFWIGLAFAVVFLGLMWGRVVPWAYYAFSPLWWGFILALDGLVYSRNNGVSLLSSKPKTLAISAFVSVFGWLFFEYYDYFVLGNWYYPNGTMPELSHAMIVALFLIAYTTVWPAIFEWYTLLKTCPKLANRYSNGPKLPLPGNLMMLAGYISIFAMVFLPYPLFWVVWIGPLVILSGQLIRKQVSSPFTALAQGNWNPLLLVALASLFNGFFWEIWNYGSAHPMPELQTNPNYWIYEIPYVNVIHIFAEMPLLGYFGYLPFGVLVWVVFIWAGQLFGFNTDIELTPNTRK
ncbi:mechanosensitive ion channel protein MscS [Methylovorus mays]|uniref:mechanosensitive ion channel protein MscS n=1 Tax=Methylovorus mays TaxID=184077 RepID=UPI001E35557D|nr:mechanosensitive ion channel protein MscS [Methylovorus mays]MCB5206589.1 mechanosensitive ion channel protein MscS [Methylovorus mays]